MKYKNNIGFAIIHRNKPISKSLVNMVVKSYKINEKLFGKGIKGFRVFICDTEHETKKHMKYYYRKRMTGTSLRNGDLVIRSSEFIGKIGKLRKKDFFKILIHEMNHVFWTFLYNTCKPCWLLEGLACYISGSFIVNKKQLKKLIKIYKVDYKILDYRFLVRKFKKDPKVVKYPIWTAFTIYIVKKYSAKQLIKLMNLYNKDQTRSNYDKLFVRLFKKTEKELFNQFLLYILK